MAEGYIPANTYELHLGDWYGASLRESDLPIEWDANYLLKIYTSGGNGTEAIVFSMNPYNTTSQYAIRIPCFSYPTQYEFLVSKGDYLRFVSKPSGATFYIDFRQISVVHS